MFDAQSLYICAGAGLDVPPEKPKRSLRSVSFRNRTRREPERPAQPAKKVKLSKKLSKLINYIQSVHFEGFNLEGEDSVVVTHVVLLLQCLTLASVRGYIGICQGLL